eukprot:gnl/MRDRNA2_/MRDRNA2_266735_c0_seq1.p1 gnl/MRDRNA2_/MRDRNA2_266735_c0~~gnl/MRDRNA2_/MRDRNA2_266735_c0_seq1.p1  ORF type:complete len:196 (-),score=17.31 gnl/MRDRNA2_/MRDRNA2_266735_c0_seq1:72-611(-)
MDPAFTPQVLPAMDLPTQRLVSRCEDFYQDLRDDLDGRSSRSSSSSRSRSGSSSRSRSRSRRRSRGRSQGRGRQVPPPAARIPAAITAKSMEYPEPRAEFQAWVPWDEANPNSERQLKCLLCKKWIVDGTSHEELSGSKEHEKNLRNHYGPPRSDWYMATVMVQKQRWSGNAGVATQQL